MIYFCGILGDVWEGIIGSIIQSIRGFMYSICVLIYKLIIYLYNLFDILCHSRIMDSQIIQQLSARVGLILGLIMLFYVSFSFIKMLIDPETITDKEKGAFNIVKKILIVIVLIGITPYLFDFSFDIQNKILGANDSNSNVISRLLLPEVVETDNFGSALSSNLFLSFYNMNPSLNDYSNDSAYLKCYNYRELLKKNIIENEDFDFGYNCLGADSVISVTDDVSNETTNVPVVDFNFVLSFVVGLFVCWMLLMYCFSVGVRVIQLAFLQIISPMAIISYLSPKKDGMFQKWGKMCFTTYLDVFIRVGIINFIVLLIAYVINGFDNLDSTFWESVIAYKTVSSTTKTFLKIIMILALLQFAKKAPELLKDLFPNASVASGDFGFGLKNRSVLGKGLAVAGGVAAGGAVGLMSERGLHRLSGGAIGMARGLGKGVMNKGAGIGDIGKNISSVGKNQFDFNKRHIALRNNDSTFWGRLAQRGRNWLGLEGQAEAMENEISKNNDIINDNTSFMNRYKEVSDLESAAETRADSKLTSKVFDAGSKGEVLQKQRIEAQSNVDLAKSELDAATQAKDSFAIAAATSKLNNMQSALNRVKDKTKKEYISRVMSGEISDSNMLSNFNQTMSSISEFGSLFTDNDNFMTDFYNSTHNSDGTCKDNITDTAYNNFVDSIKSGQFSSNSSYGDCGYALLDAFEGISTNYRNKISLDVQKAQHANEAIEKSSAYRIAKQNRDAVGGQRK